MIEYKEGDLLTETGLDGICHQANCFKRMKSGIAKAIVARYPQVEKVDKDCPLSPESRFGFFTKVDVEGPDGNKLQVFNLYGQFMYGTEKQQTNYRELENALYHMKRYIKDAGKPYRIGIPYKIGCGLAGGDWKEVNKIIRNLFLEDHLITVVIVRKDQ